MSMSKEDLYQGTAILIGVVVVVCSIVFSVVYYQSNKNLLISKAETCWKAIVINGDGGYGQHWMGCKLLQEKDQ